MKTKICSKCNIEKNVSEFYNIGFYKDGSKKYRSDCKIHQKHLPYNKQYQELYRAEHKDKTHNYNKLYHSIHKEELNEYNKQYRINNKEVLNQDKKRYNKEKRQNDPSFKLRANISTSVGAMLRLTSSNKNSNSILQFLPYTILQLRLYIENLFEPWMSWSNWGIYNKKFWNDNDQTTWTWQLDHIIPHSTFKYSSMDCQEFKDCWSLSNLRPYSAKQNIIDGSSKVRHERSKQ